MGDNARQNWEWHNNAVGVGYQAPGVVRQSLPNTCKITDLSKAVSNDLPLSKRLHSEEFGPKDKKSKKKSKKSKLDKKGTKKHKKENKSQRKKDKKSRKIEKVNIESRCSIDMCSDVSSTSSDSDESDKDTVIVNSFQFNPILQYVLAQISGPPDII